VSLPPQTELRLARSHHHSICLARVDPRQIRQRRPKTGGEHSHLMHIPTPRRSSRSKVANKTATISGRNNMITPPLQYAQAACHPPMGHLIQQVKQTSPRAQISASLDAESRPRAQTFALPNTEFSLGCNLRLARCWVWPRLPAPPRILRTATPPTVAHVTGWLKQRLEKTSPSPEQGFDLDKCSKESRRHPTQGRRRTP
jgi:hypothetical protein